MKDIGKIRKDLAKLKSIKEEDLTAKDEKRVKMLYHCIDYLKSRPREDFIKKQLLEAVKHRDFIDNNYKSWFKTNYNEIVLIKNPKSKYFTEMSRAKFIKQIALLEYLLEK